MKKKSRNNFILGIIIVGFILSALYFSGSLNTVLRQSYENTQIQFTSYRIHTSDYTNELDKFLITATIKESAKSKSEKLKSGDEFGIMISDFQQISQYEDKRFDNEIQIQYANAGLTQLQALQICKERLPTVTNCKNAYESKEECDCQAPGFATAVHLLKNYDIDTSSTLTISRSQYLWKHEYNLVNCQKVDKEVINTSRCNANPTQSGCTWDGIKCDNNIKIRFYSRYITVTGITPSDIPLPIEQPTSVQVKLILKKPGTYVYTEPHIKQFEQKCYGNDIYWYDSNGTVNSLIKACPSSQQCVNANCTLKTYECIKDDQVVCYHNNLVYMDSCGMLGSIKQTCGEDQVCLSNTQVCKDREDTNIVVNIPTNQTTGDMSIPTNTNGDNNSNTLYYIIGGIFLVLIGIILWIKFKKH